MTKRIFKNTNLKDIILKTILIGTPLVTSGIGLNFTINYALEGDYKRTLVAGACTLLSAYAAGVHTERCREE